MQDYLETTIHKLKTNLSRYIRILESEQVKAVVVYRGNKRVAALIPLTPKLKIKQSNVYKPGQARDINYKDSNSP